MVLGKKHRLLFLLLIAATVVCFLAPGINLYAEEGAAQETMAIILVIDTSGSMRGTDPQMLRETAANILIDLLSPEDYLGIITFEHDANVVLPLQQVVNTANRESFKAVLSPQLQPRGNTNFLAALETAYAQFKEFDTGGARPAVVLLTDGEPDPDPARRRSDPSFMTSYMDALWKLVGTFALGGYPIYSVAFSDEIDADVMSRISIDTKADYYILSEPSELVVSFFELLGGLKNRRGLIENTFQLQDGVSEAFDFNVDEYTRQVNLVAVNLSGGGCKLSLTPPQGDPEQIEGLTVINQGNYSMIILQQPDDVYLGKWQAAVSGRGSVRVLGDMDLYIKGWLEEPIPFSQHPVGEPLVFKVQVTGAEYLKDIPFKAEIQVTKPGTGSEVISLVKENGYYTGVYEKTDRAGTYEMDLRLLLDGQVVSSSSSGLYVKMLPSLVTDFWTGDGYRLGEEIIVTGSMNLGGRRLSAGSELKVDTFSIILDYDDGSRTILPLYDDGVQEHGDIRAGDGIWSNRLSFEQDGFAVASLLAVGEYRDGEFFLEKNLGEIAVLNPGRVLLELPKEEFWSLQGRAFSFPVQITNDSLFQETIAINKQNIIGSFQQHRFTLEPGESKTVHLEINLQEVLDNRIYTLPLVFKAENALTVVNPLQLDLRLEIVTSSQAFLKEFYKIIVTVGIVGGITLLVLSVFYIGGLLLYRLLVFPHKKISGALLCWKTESDATGDDLPQKLSLRKAKKDKVIISFNAENKNAGFYLKGSEFDYDIVIKNIWENHSSKFMQGWRALITKNISFKTMIECTQPGIIEFDGNVYTKKELFHSDEFESGGFSLQYNNPYGKWFKDKNTDGVDVLNGKA